jgi:hypothetical protein
MGTAAPTWKGGEPLIAELWEWGVLREVRNRPVGVCMTEHAAMDALSKALIATGRPARGQVGMATLVRPVREDPLYVREPPGRTAVYDGSVISWT